MRKKKLRKRIKELERICAESYQVVGVLAYELKCDDLKSVIETLDNLGYQELIHKNILPFSLTQND